MQRQTLLFTHSITIEVDKTHHPNTVQILQVKKKSVYFKRFAVQKRPLLRQAVVPNRS
jgi:hypothetical protein